MASSNPPAMPTTRIPKTSRFFGSAITRTLAAFVLAGVGTMLASCQGPKVEYIGGQYSDMPSSSEPPVSTLAFLTLQSPLVISGRTIRASGFRSESMHYNVWTVDPLRVYRDAFPLSNDLHRSGQPSTEAAIPSDGLSPNFTLGRIYILDPNVWLSSATPGPDAAPAEIIRGNAQIEIKPNATYLFFLQRRFADPFPLYDMTDNQVGVIPLENDVIARPQGEHGWGAFPADRFAKAIAGSTVSQLFTELRTANRLAAAASSRSMIERMLKVRHIDQAQYREALDRCPKHLYDFLAATSKYLHRDVCTTKSHTL